MSLSFKFNQTLLRSLATMRRAVAQGRRYRSYRRGMVLHKIVRRYERLRASKVVGLRLLGKRNRKFLSSRTCSRLCYRTSILRLWRNGYARWNAIRRGERRGRGRRIPRDRFEGKCGRGKRGKLEGRIARSRTKISFRFLALDGSNGFSYSRRMRRRGSKRAVGIYSLGRNGFRFPSRHVSSNISSFKISFIFTRDDLRNNL